jgi:hypothetical protein
LEDRGRSQVSCLKFQVGNGSTLGRTTWNWSLKPGTVIKEVSMLLLPKFDYEEPKSLPEALAMLSE